MGAVLAIASIFGLLYVKHHISANAAAASAAGPSGSAAVTGPADPSVAYDTKAPAAGDPIGSTFLSIADPVYSAGGELVGLPYRPSDPEYGGGIPDLSGATNEPNVAGSPGSGITAIDKINAPHAAASYPGGLTEHYVPPSVLPLRPVYARVSERIPVRVASTDTGSGKLPLVPASAGGPPNRAPVAPLRPTIIVRHVVSAAPPQGTPAGAQPLPAQTAPRAPIARSRTAQRRTYYA